MNDLDIAKGRDLFNTILIMDGIEQGEFIDKERASKLFTSFFNENIEDIIGENPLPIPPAAPIGTLIGYVTPKTSGIDMKQTSEIKKTEINRSFIE